MAMILHRDHNFPIVHLGYPYRWTRAVKYMTDDLIVLGWGRGKCRSRRGPMIKRILQQGRGGMFKTRERMDDKCEGQHYNHLFVPIIQNKFVRRGIRGSNSDDVYFEDVTVLRSRIADACTEISTELVQTRHPK